MDILSSYAALDGGGNGGAPSAASYNVGAGGDSLATNEDTKNRDWDRDRDTVSSFSAVAAAAAAAAAAAVAVAATTTTTTANKTSFLIDDILFASNKTMTDATSRQVKAIIFK